MGGLFLTAADRAAVRAPARLALASVRRKAARRVPAVQCILRGRSRRADRPARADVPDSALVPGLAAPVREQVEQD